MKTIEEWIIEIMESLNVAYRRGVAVQLRNYLPLIIEEAARNAISNVPPIPELKVTDGDVELLLKIEPLDGQYKEILDCFIADRKTLMRMLGDCDSTDAYLRGWAAGREAGAAEKEEDMLKEGVPVTLDPKTGGWLTGGKLPGVHAALKIVMDTSPGGSLSSAGVTVNQIRQASGLPPIIEGDRQIDTPPWRLMEDI